MLYINQVTTSVYILSVFVPLEDFVVLTEILLYQYHMRLRNYNAVLSQGSTFPGAQGHMPLDFAVGP